MNSKFKILILIILLGIGGFWFFRMQKAHSAKQSENSVTPVFQSNSPRIISTIPDPLDNY